MIREAILKRDKKSRALFILCIALYAAAFAGAIRSLIVFHWMGAFVMFIRLVKTVLMVPLPMLLATIIMLRICNSAPWRRAAANICWWYLFSVYFIILCFVLLGGFRREYDYTYLAPNYVPFATLHSQFANLFTDSYFFASILGNALLFSPLALLLPWKIHAKHNLAVSAAILIGMVILFETVQQLSHVGVFDIDDILLNSLGIAAGTVLHIPTDRLIKTHFAIR